MQKVTAYDVFIGLIQKKKIDCDSCLKKIKSYFRTVLEHIQIGFLCQACLLGHPETKPRLSYLLHSVLSQGRLSSATKHWLDLSGTSSGTCRAMQRWAVEGSHSFWISLGWGQEGRAFPGQGPQEWQTLSAFSFFKLPCLSFKIWEVKELTVLLRAGQLNQGWLWDGTGTLAAPWAVRALSSHWGVICGKLLLTSTAGEAPRQMLGRFP